MKHVQLAEARKRYAELFDEVERGEILMISRQGEQSSREMSDSRREEIRRAIDGILELRKQTKPVTIEEIIAWKNEGRG